MEPSDFGLKFAVNVLDHITNEPKNDPSFGYWEAYSHVFTDDENGGKIVTQKLALRNYTDTDWEQFFTPTGPLIRLKDKASERNTF